MAELKTPDLLHTMDFAVFGVARSGTSALGRAINHDPGCFCGIEYFHAEWRLDYATLGMPESFFSPDHKATVPRNTQRTQDILRAKLDAGEVVAYGNKHPHYFVMLEQLHRQLPNLRSICIHRRANDVADSFDRRAANPLDSWSEGRTGVFGILSWMFALARLADTRIPIRMLDYKSLFFGDHELMSRVIRFVSGRPPSATTLERIAATEYRGGGIASVQNKATRYDDFLNRIGAADLDAAVEKAAFAPVARLREVFQDFTDDHMDAVFTFVIDALRKDGTDAELHFALQWVHEIAATFDDPASRTFARLWPLMLGLTDAVLPRAGDRERLVARNFARVLRKRLQGVGDDAPVDHLLKLGAA